jgi:hypothetical protein
MGYIVIMSKYGKSLKIYLMDGIVNGRWICELSNWTGKAYKIPRTSYKKCLDRDELRSPSVYFLFGISDDTGKTCIYIGETEDAIQRLSEHIKDEKKDYWTEAIVFISKDDHLNKAHIKYLESRFYEIAKEIDRYEVMNSNPPTKSSISEAEKDEMEEFIENIQLVVYTLGYKVFEPLIPLVGSSSSENHLVDQDESQYFYINNNNLSAKGMLVSDGFIIRKDSDLFSNKINKSLGKNIIKLRELYCSDGTVVNGRFMKDTLFSSPSAASDFLHGYPTSGPRQWKNKEGKTLKDINDDSITK